jgi:predicted amino acid dehydrogenase
MGDSAAGLAVSGLPATVDFALIGHQESWRAAADVLAVLRGPEHTPLPDDEIKDILPWIPPRAVCHVRVGSISSGVRDAKAHGLYIDSFIPPDRLGAAYTHENIARVRGAAAYAIKAGARIVSLGGFSSILIEGNFDQLPERQDTAFTTGNTLTSFRASRKCAGWRVETSEDQLCSSLELPEMWVPVVPVACRLS